MLDEMRDMDKRNQGSTSRRISVYGRSCSIDETTCRRMNSTKSSPIIDIGI